MIGEVVHHYQIIELLGRGGMGTVYKAAHINLTTRYVALKVLNADLQNDPDFVARFHHEADIQSKLEHPNVAILFDYFVHKNLPVMVMQYIEGETLQDMIARQGPIPAHLSLPMFKQAMEGVSAGHRLNIWHRDLKPANLMVNKDRVVKVTDFGIAKLKNSVGLTQVSTRIGSSAYMAPEQIRGKEIDQRTDIYAMGITLYELLSGHTPFSAPSLYEIENLHVNVKPPPPTVHYPHIPQAAVDAVMKALEKDPADRFQSAQEFVDALPDLKGIPYVGKTASVAQPAATAVADDRGATREAMPNEHPSQTRATATSGAPLQEHAAGRRPWVAGGLIGVLSIGAIGAFLWQQRSPVTTEKPTIANSPAGGGSSASEGALPPSTASRPSTSSLTQTLKEFDEPTPVTPAPAPKTSPAYSDFVGDWQATYQDPSGNGPRILAKAILHLEPQDAGHAVAAGNTAYKGTLTYRSLHNSQVECKLSGSSYSPETRQLRVLSDCGANAGDPNFLFLNFPLVFDHIKPTQSALQGGHLENLDQGMPNYHVSMSRLADNPQ